MHTNPQQPPHGYPPPYPQPMIVQKRGGGCLKALLIGVVVLVGLAALGALLGGGPDESGVTTVASAPDEPAEPDEKKPKQAGIGDVVKDGKFSFKVTKVEKGLSQVGEGFTVSKAQGQYVLIHLTVKNIGDEAQMFTDSAQKLIDAKGRTFDADSGAAIWLPDSNAFLENINPGNSVNGILVFDVPESLTLKAVELHDSIFSAGVTVSLK